MYSTVYKKNHEQANNIGSRILYMYSTVQEYNGVQYTCTVQEYNRVQLNYIGWRRLHLYSYQY